MTGEKIVRLLAKSGRTLATAESLTAGLLSAKIGDVSGASQAFLGGVIAYQDEIKGNMLSVLPETLAEFTAVSAQTAREMALGARKKFHADYALSTTGYAGPTGENIGLVYIGLSTEKETRAYELHLAGSRQGIRKMTVQIALHLLQKEIENHGEKSKR